MASPKAPDPKSLLGNPLRTAPASGESSDVPLNLDEAMSRSPLPGGIPNPFPESPFNTNESAILANQQATIDYEGVVQPFMNFMSSNNLRKPGPTELQHYATTSGVTFTYGGEVYKPGKYVPG